jgi:hypothetical protein
MDSFFHEQLQLNPDTACAERKTPWSETEYGWSPDKIGWMHNYIAQHESQKWKPKDGGDAPVANECNMERDGTDEQKIAYRLVHDHWKEKRSKDQSPLHLIVHGTAGTGKSWLLKSLKQLIKDQIFLTGKQLRSLIKLSIFVMVANVRQRLLSERIK